MAAIHWTRANPLEAVSTGLLVFFLVCMLLPSLLTSHDPYELRPGERLQAPSLDHWLGTDEMGRDLWSRIVYGSRVTLASAVGLVMLAALFGGLVGLVSGYYGGLLDEVIMRVTDLFLAFPRLVLTIAIVSALGRGMLNAVLAFSVVWWAQYARLMRAQTLVVRQKEFVLGAVAVGQSDVKIVWSHLAPNCLSPVFVKATMDVGLAVLLLSSLSFLGLGVQPPIPEWGGMIATGRKYLLDYWWYATFPGVAIYLAVLAINILGEWLKEKVG